MAMIVDSVGTNQPSLKLTSQITRTDDAACHGLLLDQIGLESSRHPHVMSRLRLAAQRWSWCSPWASKGAMYPAGTLSQSGMAGFAGPCTRCEMVCMDQRTGLKAGPEPLLTLASFRRIKGRILFGILLSHQPSPLLQHQHMRAPQQGSGNHESHDPAQMRQQLNAVAMRGEEGDGQATVRFLSTQQTAQGRLEDDIFPVLRVGMPLIPSM